MLPSPLTQEPLFPGLTFLATVALRFQTPLNLGEPPGGVRFELEINGTVDGPRLKGRLASSTAYVLIDPDGVGLLSMRAPLLLTDGVRAELEATGRFDFGSDGYRRAVAADLPRSSLGCCPRVLTGHPHYAWLNRSQCLGVGELRPKEMRIDWDLFFVTSQSP